MGCCGGRARARTVGKRGVGGISRGVKAQVKPRPIKVKSYGRGITRKTCPKCGYVMSHSVLKYDPIAKTAQQSWACMNKACRYKIKK